MLDDGKLLPIDYKSNITFSDECLIKTLNEIKHSSFDYILEEQKNLVGYETYNFKASDFTKETSKSNPCTYKKRYVLNVPKQLIPTSNRELYKRSRYFCKEITIHDIANNDDIFVNNFIVFIDGLLYTRLKLLILDNITQIVIYLDEDIPKKVFEEWMVNKVDISVMFIPNSTYNEASTNKYVIDQYNYTIPKSKISAYGNNSGTNQDSINLIGCSSSKNSNTMYILPDSEITDDGINIQKNYISLLEDSTTNIGIVSLRYLDDIIHIPGGNGYFEIPLRKHVVPLTSFIAFYKEDNILKYYHNIDIKMFYPNIYKVTTNTDKEILLYVFYCEPKNCTPFVNELELYYRFFKDSVLDRYKNGTIPTRVKNYKPNQFPVSIKHLIQSSLKNRPLDYKVNRYNEFINLESKTLNVYLQHMLKNRQTMFIYTKDIDLQSRIRTDTSLEIEGEPFIFDEEQYVFKFNKSFINDFDVRFFIDGKFYNCNQTFCDEDLYYFYIPTSIITNDSIIEIEKYHELEYNRYIVFDTSIKEIYIKDNICTPSDVFFIYRNENYLNESKFCFIITENGEEIEVDCNSMKPLGERFKIKILDKSLLNQTIDVRFKKTSAVYELKIDSEEMKDKTVLIGNNISRHKGHFRIFRNGRLIPPEMYTIRFKSKVNSYTVLNIKMNKKVGDIYHIEFNPNIYYSTLYDKKIPTDGMLDFGGKLNKPFNPKWFDVYLNGFKLTKDNFDILTPRFVLIKNVNTDDNISILEKNWHYDIFKYRTTSENPIPTDFQYNMCTDDTFVINDSDVKNAIDNIKEKIIIDDSIENILTDIIEDNSDEFARNIVDVFRYFLNMDLFINPDIQYSKDVIPKAIEDLFKINGNIINIMPLYVENTTTPVLINPDNMCTIDSDDIDMEGGIVLH